MNAGEGQAAEGLFSSALKLWRGPALTDFRFEDFAQESIRRLEGKRRTTIVDRVDALLALGQQEQAVLDLRRVIEDALAARAASLCSLSTGPAVEQGARALPRNSISLRPRAGARAEPGARAARTSNAQP